MIGGPAHSHFGTAPQRQTAIPADAGSLLTVFPTKGTATNQGRGRSETWAVLCLVQCSFGIFLTPRLLRI